MSTAAPAPAARESGPSVPPRRKAAAASRFTARTRATARSAAPKETRIPTSRPTPATTPKTAIENCESYCARTSGRETKRARIAGSARSAASRSERRQGIAPLRASRTSSTTRSPTRVPHARIFQEIATQVAAVDFSRARTHSSGSFKAVAKSEGTSPARPVTALLEPRLEDDVRVLPRLARLALRRDHVPGERVQAERREDGDRFRARDTFIGAFASLGFGESPAKAGDSGGPRVHGDGRAVLVEGAHVTDVPDGPRKNRRRPFREERHAATFQEPLFAELRVAIRDEARPRIGGVLEGRERG